jgi:hypothetical protein
MTAFDADGTRTKRVDVSGPFSVPMLKLLFRLFSDEASESAIVREPVAVCIWSGSLRAVELKQ